MRRGGASKGQRGSKTESRAHQEGRATGSNCAGSRGGGEPSIDLLLAAGRPTAALARAVQWGLRGRMPGGSGLRGGSEECEHGHFS